MVTKDLKFWLDEADLKTPIHDEMVLWTFKNFQNILDDLNIKFITHIWDSKEKQIIEIKEKTIEFPLKGYNGFNLGYLDLLILYKINNGWFEFKSNLGSVNSELAGIAFEIKPQVKSIGEVLRQFQYYKSNINYPSKLVLVTQTTGLKEIFESQGFYVYEYQKGNNNGATN